MLVIEKTRIGDKCMPTVRNIFDGLTDFMSKQGKKSAEAIANQVDPQNVGKIKQILIKGKNLVAKTYNKGVVATSEQFKKLINNTEDGLLKEIAVSDGIIDYARANNIVKDDNLLIRMRKTLIADLKDKKFAEVDGGTFEVELNEIKRQVSLPKLTEEMVDEAKKNKLAGKVVGKVTGNVALVGGAATGAVEATKLDDDNLEAKFGKRVKSVGSFATSIM